MSRRDLERKLQEYLDGRLPERERADVEASLRRDPELAERVALDRAVGEVLRRTIDEPPPGLASRARARFEERQRAQRSWVRVLSWEAAGVVAAVVLLAFLFLPFPWRERGTALEEDGAKPRGDSATEGAPGLSSTNEGRAVVETPRRQNDEQKDEKEVVESKASPPSAPAPPADVRVRRKSESADLVRDSGVPEVDQASGVAAPSAALRQAGFSVFAFSARGAAVPVGALDHETVQVIESRETNVAEEFARPALREPIAALGAIGESERVLLVGPRTRPFSCLGYHVARSGEALRVALAAPDSGLPPSEGGCALVIPAGPLQVVVEDPPDDRP